MAEPRDTRGFASRLIRLDPLPSDTEYQEYRTKLETALRAAERRVKVTGWIAVASCIVMVAVLFLFAGKLFDDPDPWLKESGGKSMAASVAFLVAMATFFLSLAAYYSRYRPGVRDARERLRDAMLLDLQRQVRDLRELLEQILRRDKLDSN
jgi:hypothetical protein